MALPSAPRQPTSVARGAALAVAMRWTDRLIGIASTLILARLLVPADFGIVAMASLVVSLVDMLLDLGVNTALVQKRDADVDDFHTAWTLRLGQSILAAAIIAFVGAPLAASYFNDVRVEPVLWAMAATLLVGGFENIGLVALQKNMEFGREFRFFFYRRLVGFAVTIALALWLHSYWAMVIGALVGKLAGVALSYAMHEFRPRLSTRKIGALWSFSQWMLLRNLGTYGALQVDKLVVGRRAGAATLGHYTLADEIAAMPVTELLAPIGRVLLPAFVRVADRPAELRRAFGLALGVQTLIALPAGVGLTMVADTAVPLLLGAQWTAAIPLVQVLALIGVATALTHSSAYLLLALGKVKLQAVFVWGQLLVLAGLLWLALPSSGAEAIAKARLAVAIAAMFGLFALAIATTSAVRLADILRHSWRPVAGTAAMAAVLYAIPAFPEFPAALRLAAQVAIGALVYALAIFVLWRSAGSPEGAERYVLEKLGIERRRASGEGTGERMDAIISTNDGAASVVAAARTVDLPPAALDLLESAGRHDPELGRAWFDNLQHNVFADDPGVRFVAVMRSSHCRVVLPVRTASRSHVRAIASLSNFYTSLYAPALAPDATREDVAEALAAAGTVSAPMHEMRFGPMDPHSRAFALLESALKQRGWMSFRYFCFGNWYLEVDGTWREYFARRPGEVQSTVNRMSRRFAKAGGSLAVVRNPADAEATEAAFREVYESSWKKPEPHPGFIPGLVRDLAISGSLRLGIARLGDRPVAAQIWSVRAGRAAIIKLAHRTDSTEFSPGTVLTAHMMESAIDIDGVKEVDYLIGDDPYKRNWMTRRRERWGLVAYNPRSVVGLALLVREALARAAKRGAAALRGTSSRVPADGPPDRGARR
jgi:O-antigen/teichoic acid export membrane protein